jgi:transcriptional regulator with XRE-family HTH domain
VKAQQRTATSLKSGLGAAIRRPRFILRISKGELALSAELHRTYISDLERGARNPSVESIEKLAAALQISVAKLFEQAAGKA